MNRISVIIPVYNAEKHLKKTINSLKNQSIFNQLEIFFINDGSTDNSFEILESFKENNVNIVNKENGGVSSARNVGIEKSTTEFICFIDADDYLEKDYFETLFEKSKYDLVVNGYIAEYPDKKVENKLNKDLEINNTEKIIFNFLNGVINPNSWGKLYKKSIIGNLRFDESLSHSEDRLFVFEYLKKCRNIYIQSNLKYHYVIHKESAMRKNFNGYKVINDFKEFASISDVVIANRLDEQTKLIEDKIYTRDLFRRD